MPIAPSMYFRHKARQTDPLLIDLDNDGFALTSPATGVSFDLRADGHAVHTAWTRGDARDAFLVLDRNGNGTIDDGSELFSDMSPQPANVMRRNGKVIKPNGFLALSVFDERAHGGNGDGLIDESDTVFGSLRLWIDSNHNGISEPGELKSLDEEGVRSLSLHFVPGKRKDDFGNIFGYRSHVIMDRDLESQNGIARRAVNVFFRYTAP